MKISDFIKPETIILNMDVSSKSELLRQLVQHINKDENLCSHDKILEALWEREKIGSTGIGRGVAFPHAKCEYIDEIKAVLGITKQPIDFDSLDDVPVRVFFMLLIPEDNQKVGVGTHIKILSLMTCLLSQESFMSRLLHAKKKEECFDLLCEAEKKKSQLRGKEDGYDVAQNNVKKTHKKVERERTAVKAVSTNKKTPVQEEKKERAAFSKEAYLPETEVSVSMFIDAFKNEVEILNKPEGAIERKFRGTGVQRLGLTFLSHFADYHLRYMQAVGRTEMTYLENISKKERVETVSNLMQKKPICLVFCHHVKIPDYFMDEIKKAGVVALRTSIETRSFIEKVQLWMKQVFVKKRGVHGTLMEVYGVGVLLLGLSGVGKSECALELTDRGHRLVADDNVIVTNVDNAFLIGSASKVLPYHIEIRGIGLVDVKDIYGAKAVRDQKHINLVVQLEEWNENSSYNRLGEKETCEILGVTVPQITIPIKPGRSLAVLIEVACSVNRLESMGKSTMNQVEETISQAMREKGS